MVQSQRTQGGKQTRICVLLSPGSIRSFSSRWNQTNISGIKKPRRSLWGHASRYDDWPQIVCLPLDEKVGAAERCKATSDMFTWHINKTKKKPQRMQHEINGRQVEEHVLSHNLQHCSSSVFSFFFSFCPVIWLTAAAANLMCLCGSRFRGVGGRAGRKRVEECLQYTFEANLDI